MAGPGARRPRARGSTSRRARQRRAAIDQVGRPFAAGCFDFLVKPLAPALLLAILADRRA